MSDSRKPSETRPGRMAALARLPVFFALDGKRAIVAGGSPAAAWKAELLCAAGAEVEAFAAEPSEEMVQMQDDLPQGTITLHRRDWAAADLNGAAIAVGAFDTDATAGQFAAAAREAGVPVNVIDKPAYCDFAFGSIVNRSPLVIGISTDGAAPIFAQAIRAKFEAMLPQGFARWAAAAARWRGALKVSGLSFAGRRSVWQLFTSHAMRNPDREPHDDDLRAFIEEVRGLGVRSESGSVVLVGAGPGDPELLTLRAVRALQSADVILFDDLVSRDVLDFARREAKKMLVGKSGYGPSCRQDDINALMVRLAKQGKRVVRLKGGDPLIFGRASEEIAACREANLSVEVVPGISAAQGAAAKLGLSLTDRKHARRLQYVTGHARDGKLLTDLDWRSLADPATTTVIYMPTGTLDALVKKGAAEGLDPLTPALAIARATRPDQAVVSGPIGELGARIEQANLPGPVLVMVGRICEGVDVPPTEELRITPCIKLSAATDHSLVAFSV